MTLRDGYHELSGPYELVETRDGVPVRYASLSRTVPDPTEERAIVARIEALTGVRVRLEAWVVEDGDPRDSGRTARVVTLA
jgi:hypothetical protein